MEEVALMLLILNYISVNIRYLGVSRSLPGPAQACWWPKIVSSVSNHFLIYFLFFFVSSFFFLNVYLHCLTVLDPHFYIIHSSLQYSKLTH